MPLIEKHTFSEGIDGDSSPRFLNALSALNIMNGRFANSEFGRTLRIENTPGTTRIPQTVYPPYGTQLCIGGVADDATDRILYFLWSSFGDHAVYCLDYTVPSVPVIYAVVYDSQVVGGLNFSKSFRIDKNARVVNGLLYWTDNNGDPHSINVGRGIKTNNPSFPTNLDPYAFPIPYETLTLIQRPPIYPLEMTKMSNGAVLVNYIQNQAYQYNYFYIFKDYQQSALSPFSPLAPYNAAAEDSNFVRLNVPFAEKIPDYAQQVCLCVRYGNVGNTFIIKRFDKNYSVDADAIVAHNFGVTKLTFDFYDNEYGEALDFVTANTSFDNVALEAKTLEAASSRLFLGNVLKGYDSPLLSSLDGTIVTVDSGNTGTFAGNWGYVTLHANWGSIGGCQDSYMYPFVFSTTAPHKYYYFPAVRQSPSWNGGTFIPDLTTSENIADATIQTDTEIDFVNNLKFLVTPYTPTCTLGSPRWQITYQISYDFFGTNYPITLSSFSPTILNRFFKSSSDYTINIEFKDRFNRKCGVVRKGVGFTIPNRTYGQTTFSAKIKWTLNNANAINEIPDWAWYYQIVIKKNQTTRFFEQIRAKGVQYVTKNQDGTFTYGNTYTFGTTFALGIDITAFINYGLGYSFNEGDFAHLIKSDNTFFTLKVLGQDGNFVWLSPTDVGTGSTSTIIFLELYTPYKPSVTEPYYEVPAVYPIIDPTTINRAYSTLTDVIDGDTYAIQRTDAASATYLVEAMSPNDKEWQIWQTDTGWPNFLDFIGQVRKKTNTDWSDTYINGTKNNGFGKFQPLNTKDVGANLASIQKLQLANKTAEQGQGNVMLAICPSDTASMYLGEVQLMAAAQAGDISSSNDVIGTLNILKGGMGTINPESVEEYLGLVFWIDALNSGVVQYSDNGNELVSRYKQTRFFKRYLTAYMAASPGNLDNINGFHHLPTSIDPFYKTLLCTLPALVYPNYAQTLPSYTSIPSYATSIINRFDIFDSLGKTMAFEFLDNKWGENWEYMAEHYCYLQNTLFAFKNGNVYIHNSDTTNWNTFYGTSYPTRICFTANVSPSLLKDLATIAVEASAIPDFVVAMANSPDIQITDLASTDDAWDDLQGVFYGQFLRDRLSPNVSGTPDEKLYTGDQLTDVAVFVMCEFAQYNGLFYVHFVDIGWEVSKGQKAIADTINK